MELQNYLKRQQEFHDSLNERISSTHKKLLKDQIYHEILPNRFSRKALKKLAGMYPQIKEIKFVSDLIKGKSTKAQYKHVFWTLKKYLRCFENIQSTAEAKNTPDFNKDKRIKTLSYGVKCLEIIETELRKNIKSGGGSDWRCNSVTKYVMP